MALEVAGSKPVARPISLGVTGLPTIAPRRLHDAGVAELVDALDLGSVVKTVGGSSPSARTMVQPVAAVCPPVCLSGPGDAKAGHCWAPGAVCKREQRFDEDF